MALSVNGIHGQKIAFIAQESFLKENAAGVLTSGLAGAYRDEHGKRNG